MKRALKKGFTIIELVIVIAIVSVLAAVLIPIFGSVVEKAENAVERQRAHNRITELLTLNNGRLPDGTFVYSKDNGGSVYAFENNRVVLAETESIIKKNQEYTVCVSAACLSDESSRHTAEAAITSVMRGVVEGCATAELPVCGTDDRFVVVLKSAEGNEIDCEQVVYVNYYEEINSDAVVFLFGDAELDLKKVSPSQNTENTEREEDSPGSDDENVKIGISFATDSLYSATIMNGTNKNIGLSNGENTTIKTDPTTGFSVMLSCNNANFVIVKINGVAMSFDENGNAFFDGKDKVVVNYDRTSILSFYLEFSAEIEIYAGMAAPKHDESDKDVDSDSSSENKIKLTLKSQFSTDSIYVNDVSYYSGIEIELPVGKSFVVNIDMLRYVYSTFFIIIGDMKININEISESNLYVSRNEFILTFSDNITEDIIITAE